MRRWWRYVIERLGAYNVIWTLAGEYNMNDYGGFGLPFWKDLGAMVKSEDPYAPHRRAPDAARVERRRRRSPVVHG